MVTITKEGGSPEKTTSSGRAVRLLYRLYKD